ncbi:MAG: hypothetical protein AB1324_02405 [Candidatus Micrarchaeota archaeon]
MKFSIAGREVVISGQSGLIVLAVFVFTAILLAAAVALAAFAATGALDFMSFTSIQLAAAPWIALAAQPFSAFLYLKIAGLFKRKADSAYCRSIAGADWLFKAAIFTLGTLAGFYLGAPFPVQTVFGWLGTQLAAAAGSVALYWWMLMLAGDRKAVLGAVAPSAMFALAISALGHAMLFAMSYQRGLPYSLDAGALNDVLVWFMFALPAMCLSAKADRDAAIVFAAFHAGGGLMLTLANYPAILAGDAFPLAKLMLYAASLALIYALIGEDARARILKNPSG